MNIIRCAMNIIWSYTKEQPFLIKAALYRSQILLLVLIVRQWYNLIFFSGALIPYGGFCSRITNFANDLSPEIHEINFHEIHAH